MEIQKSKSKCFEYKRSRIDKLVTDSIAKGRSKEEKATLKKIKEVEERINKSEEISKLNHQVRLKNTKKSKKSLQRKPNHLDVNRNTLKVSDASKTSIQNPRAWREFFEVK